MTFTENEKNSFMQEAVKLALKGKRKTMPNPCVGAVLVKDNNVVAKGYHKACGQPHAEIEALKDAKNKGIDISSCAMFVTLEPCNHEGKTPPCTKAILKAGIKSVYIGAVDDNPEVEGNGAEFLVSEGVLVETGIMQKNCEELISDFNIWKNHKRPYCILKMASSLDGKIATRTGDSSWISCEESRKQVHQLRAGVDAVIVGGNTFKTDNPKLNVRNIEGVDYQPLAVAVSSILPEKNDFYLIEKRAEQTVFITSESQNRTDRAESLRNKGCRIIAVAREKGRLDMKQAMQILFREYGCYHVLCEGGGALAYSLIEENLADEMHFYISPKIIGDKNAVNVFSGASTLNITEAISWNVVKHEMSGCDIHMVLKP